MDHKTTREVVFFLLLSHLLACFLGLSFETAREEARETEREKKEREVERGREKVRTHFKQTNKTIFFLFVRVRSGLVSLSTHERKKRRERETGRRVGINGNRYKKERGVGKRKNESLITKQNDASLLSSLLLL